MKCRLFAVMLACLIASLPFTLALEVQLTYDQNGNLVTGDGKYRVYNSLNQLSAIHNGTNSSGVLLETFTYHPTEERILVKKTYNPGGSVNTTTYYLSKTFVRIVNSSGTYDQTFVYHEGQLVAQNTNGTTLFIHGNHEGSSSVVTNASGAIVERTEYSPFGERLNSSQARFGYEGKEADSLVGDTDFNFRKYNPQWAMFTQPDSLLPNVYDPQLLNRYSFERNNPYRYHDLTGHFPEEVDALVNRMTDRVSNRAAPIEIETDIVKSHMTSRDWNYDQNMREYRSYYPVSRQSTLSFSPMSWRSPSEEEINEWANLKHGYGSPYPRYSLERGMLEPSTPNTENYYHAISTAAGISGNPFIDVLLGFGGSATLRLDGIATGLVALYTRIDPNTGQTIYRYQFFDNPEAQEEWEASNSGYSGFGGGSGGGSGETDYSDYEGSFCLESPCSG